MAEHIRVGKLGESTVVKHLSQKGFRVIDRNYRKKWGEIDVIARKGDYIHFIEVKTTAREARGSKYGHPAQKVDARKIARLGRAIQTYAIENDISLKRGEWQCDIYVVYLDHDQKQANVEVIENIVVPGK